MRSPEGNIGNPPLHSRERKGVISREVSFKGSPTWTRREKTADSTALEQPITADSLVSLFTKSEIGGDLSLKAAFVALVQESNLEPETLTALKQKLSSSDVSGRTMILECMREYLSALRSTASDKSKRLAAARTRFSESTKGFLH